MFNRIKASTHPRGLNKGLSSRFCVGTRLRHETLEEGQRIYRPKRCEYNNKDEVRSPNILSDNKPEVGLCLVIWFNG